MKEKANKIDIEIGKRLRSARRAAGVSQQALAATLGVTFQQVQKYEIATNRISGGKLKIIADFLGRDIDYFFDKDSDVLSNLSKSHFETIKSINLITCAKRLQYVKHTANFMAQWEKEDKETN